MHDTPDAAPGASPSIGQSVEPPCHRGDVFVTPDGSFAASVATWLGARLRHRGASSGGRVSIALAGGGTPRDVYEVLATLPDIPWGRVDVFFGDERAVPSDDAASNYRMARESLLDHVPIESERIHPMNGAAESLTVAAEEYSALLPDSLDLILLGIGGDCHTASLFPGSDNVLDRQRRVMPASSPDPPVARLTVGPLVLERSREIVVMAFGAAKSLPVLEALTGSWNPLACPAQLARRGSWLLDSAAAARLPRSLAQPLPRGSDDSS